MDTRLSGHTILVVEDEPLVAFNIIASFKLVGASVAVARSLADARALVEGRKLCAAVVDFGLADGDANDLCVRLNQKHVPFVLHSGYSHVGIACTPAAVIPKPASADLLVTAVCELLGGKTMSPREQVLHNGLLNALSAADFALLQPNLKSVPLHFRQQMERANSRIQTVYFIESGLGSVVAIGGGERRQAEVAVVGCEGMTGIPVVLGTERSPCDVFMQVEGSGQSIEADQLTKAMEQSLTMTRCFTRFAHVFAVQGYYTALANAQGTIEERLARWLLMAQDRIGGDVLTLTHEFLALMLGVRRAGVSTALQHFEAQALIRTSRGAVKVTDRGGLHQSANGFYGHPEAELERLFPSSSFSGRRSLQEGPHASRNAVI